MDSMKFGKISRRRLLFYAVLAAPALAGADSEWIEPQWVKVRTWRMSREKPAHRVVHFTDVHHKGDRAYLASVVRRINALGPDLVCFTGDLVEKAGFLPETLELLGGIKAPLYGVPGNHDYWSRANFAEIGKCFAATGGAWLLDERTSAAGGRIHMCGATCLGNRLRRIPAVSGTKNIMLLHYPLLAEQLEPERYDLILAGHSHGGQVRIPFYGALILPNGVGKYEIGMFRLPAGPLYVNPGIGWLETPVRFNCRPEITVFEI
jgi:hypothetical protein